MKLKIAKAGGGGEDPGKKKPPSSSLTYDQINKWSSFAESNPGKDFQSLWMQFSKSNPKSGIDPIVLQSDLQKLRENAVRMANQRGLVSGENTNTGLSFPRTVVDGKDYGRMNAMMQTQQQPALTRSIPSSKVFKSLPSGVEDVWFDEKEQLVGFVNPQTGDIDYATIDNLNHPMLKKKQATQSIFNAK